jgi:RND family efflux transporter MFP subunit
MKYLDIKNRALKIGLLVIVLSAKAFFNPYTLWALDEVQEIELRIADRLLAVMYPLKSATLSAEVLGIVRKVGFEMGDAFKAGDILVHLDTDRHLAAKQKAEAVLQSARAAYNTYRELYRQKSVSDVELAKAKAELDIAKANLAIAKRELSSCSIRAPYSGRVVKLLIKENELVQQGQPLVEIVDDSEMRAKFMVPSVFYPDIEIGQILSVHISGIREPFECRLTHVSPVLESNTSTFQVFGAIDNPHGLLRGGMTGQISLKVASPESNTVLEKGPVVLPEEQAYLGRKDFSQNRARLQARERDAQLEDSSLPYSLQPSALKPLRKRRADRALPKSTFEMGKSLSFSTASASQSLEPEEIPPICVTTQVAEKEAPMQPAPQKATVHTAKKMEATPTQGVPVKTEPLQVKEKKNSSTSKELENKTQAKDTIVGDNGYLYTLHLSSWKRLKKARAELNEQQKRGFEAYAIKVNLGDKGTWWGIYVGHYKSAKEAQQAKEQLKLADAIVKKRAYANLVGTYDTAEAMKNMARKLEQLGYFSHTVSGKNDELQLLTGAFFSRKSAEAQNRDLKSDGIDARVIHITSAHAAHNTGLTPQAFSKGD